MSNSCFGLTLDNQYLFSNGDLNEAVISFTVSDTELLPTNIKEKLIISQSGVSFACTLNNKLVCTLTGVTPGQTLTSGFYINNYCQHNINIIKYQYTESELCSIGDEESFTFTLISLKL